MKNYINISGIRKAVCMAAMWSMTVGLLGQESSSLPLDWQWSNPDPHGNDIREFEVFGTFGVQVGAHGVIYISDDMVNWQRLDAPDTLSLRCLTVFGGNFYIGAESGVIYKTANFREFTKIDLGTEDWIEGITASDSLLVAVGDNGAVYTSTDGASWDRRASGTDEWLRDVVFGGNRFVAVGEGGTIISSFNGVAWSRATTGTSSNLNAVTNNGSNQFAVAGDAGVLLRSSNGTGWTSVATGTDNDLLAVIFGDSLVVAVGDRAGVSVSSGGSVTQLIDENVDGSLPSYLWQSITWDGTSFHVGGSAGLTYQAAESTMEWTTSDDSIRPWIWDLESVDDQAIAVGDFGSILVSQDGVNWDLRNVPEAVRTRLLLGVAGTGDGVIAVGAAGTILHSPAEIISIVTTNVVGGVSMVSTNETRLPGITWNQIDPSPVDTDLKGTVAYEGGFVVVGQGGTILTSPDGTQWDSLSSPVSEFLSGVATDGSSLVAVGNNGTVLNSPDGVSWSIVPGFTQNWLLQVRYLNGHYVTCGQGGFIATSPDGVQWTVGDTPSSTALVNDVTYSDGVYYAAGTLGRIWSSPDGLVWKSLSVVTSKSLYSLRPFDGRLIAVGIEGVIIRAALGPILDPLEINVFETLQSSDGTEEFFGFILQGKTDQYYRLDQAPSVMGPWTGIDSGEITSSDGSRTVIHPSGDIQSPVFFRAVPVESQ